MPRPLGRFVRDFPVAPARRAGSVSGTPPVTRRRSWQPRIFERMLGMRKSFLIASAPALAALATIVCVSAAQRPAPPAGPDPAPKAYTPADLQLLTGIISHHTPAV